MPTKDSFKNPFKRWLLSPAPLEKFTPFDRGRRITVRCRPLQSPANPVTPATTCLMSAYARGRRARRRVVLRRATNARCTGFVRRHAFGTALAAQTDEVFQDTWLRVASRARAGSAGRELSNRLFTLAHQPRDRLLRARAPRCRSRLRKKERRSGEPGNPHAQA